MSEEKDLLNKIIKNKEALKLEKEIQDITAILKQKQARLKEIKPVSGFNAGWFMGSMSAYDNCIKILER